MKCSSLFSVFLLWLCTREHLVSGFPYANDYPHVQYGFRSKSNRNSADEGGFLENKASDGLDNRKASVNAAKFYNLENVSNGHKLHHNKQGSATNSLKEATGEDYENDKSHTRKHIKSGFHNTYHKDESGSNSSYYEDSDDHGGKSVYDKRTGLRGDSNGSRYEEGRRDDNLRDKYDNRMGSYDSRGEQNRKHYTTRDKFGQNGGRDRYESVDQSNSGYYPPPDRNYDRHRPVSEDAFLFSRPSSSLHDRHHHHQHHGHSHSSVGTGADEFPFDERESFYSPVRDHHRPVDGMRGSDHYFSRHHITIYEDPRETVDPRLPGARRREDFNFMREPVLDFRPSHERYFRSPYVEDNRRQRHFY